MLLFSRKLVSFVKKPIFKQKISYLSLSFFLLVCLLLAMTVAVPMSVAAHDFSKVAEGRAAANTAAPPILVSATIANNNLKIGETSIVTFVFSTPVTGFTTADLTVPNGYISNLSTTDGGMTWVGVLTPYNNIQDATNIITVALTGVTSVVDNIPGVGSAYSDNYAIDTYAPSITAVSAATANGTYSLGDVIDITISFTENVTVSGTPKLRLETGAIDRDADYFKGTGTSTLTFRYTVDVGDSNPDLDYVSTSALILNGGSIRDIAGNNATLTLAAPGAAGSLGANKNIIISVGNTAPSISNLNGDSPAWAGVGSMVTLDVAGNATVSDAEFGVLNGGNGNWEGASLTVQRSGAGITSDIFGFNTSGAGFSVSGSNLQSGGLTFATFTSVAGVLTINFTSSGVAATTALVQDVIRRITYRNDTPAGDAVVSFTLSDGSANVTANVNVTSDTIYITNPTDTHTIDIANGVSFSEAVAIAAADATGSQTLVFTNSFTGPMALAGNLNINESLTINTDAAAGLSITGGTITIGPGTTTTFTNGAGTVRIASTLAGAGSLVKSGAGTLILSGSNTYEGGTTVSAGALELRDGNAIADNGAVTVMNGASLVLSNAAETIGSLAGAGNVVLNADLTTGGNNANTAFSGVLSGSAGLIKLGSGTLSLSGVNTYTGATVVNAGALALNAIASISKSGRVTVSAGSALLINANQTLNFLTGAGSVVLIANLTAGGDNTSTTFSGIISGVGGLIKSGTGTLTLSGLNTYGGSTTINAGALELRNGAAIRDDNPVTVEANGMLVLFGATETIGSLAGTGNAILNGKLTVGGDNSSTIFSGVIKGAGSLSKKGTGTLTLSGANAFTGGTQIVEGTVMANHNTALGVGMGSMDVGVTLGTTVENTTLTNQLVLNGGASIKNDVAMALTGHIDGPGSLIKSGTGTLTLSGENGYLGLTTVSAGRLLVNGALAGTSSVNVDAGATLGGTGRIFSGSTNTLTVQSGGTLAPGNSAGILTVNGNLQMKSGSTLAIEINGTTAGTDYDQVVVDGVVDISGATLAVTHGYVAGLGDRYTVLNNSGTDVILNTFSGLAEGGTVTAGGNGTVLTASYIGGTGNDFTLTAPINTAPTDITLSNSAINENVAPNTIVGTLSTTDADLGDTFTYSFVAGTGDTDNSSFTISGNSLKILISPNYEVKQSYSVRIKTTDSGGSFFEKSFVISIADVNEAPVATNDSYFTDEDVPLNIAAPGLLANDTDSDLPAQTLIPEIVLNPAKGTLTLNDDGSFVYTPHANFYGADSFRYWISDGSLQSNIATVTITVNPVNDAPTISGTPATTVEQDAAYSFIPTASDIEDDVLTFSISNKPAWASFNTATGALTGTPGNADVGTTMGIVISVSDGSLSASLPVFTITVVNVNDAPTISMAGAPTSVLQGQLYDFTPVSADIDGDVLIYDAVNLPGWLSVDHNTGRIWGIPTNADVGTHPFESYVRVSDDNGVSWIWSESDFFITVINVNDAPTISGTPATSVNQDVAYSFTPTATDMDEGDVLTFSITNKPTWASFNTTTGALTGTPGNADVGTTTGIVITVSDGTLSASLPAFSLEVKTVLITGISLEEGSFTYDGTAKSLAIKGTPPQGTTVSYSNNSQINAGLYTVTAVISGGNYKPLTLKAEMTINKAKQTISFKAPSDLGREIGTVALDVKSTSGLPVSLTSDDAMVATVSGTDLNVLRLGTVRITATQAGNDNYEAASPVTVSVRVANGASAKLPVRVNQALSPNGDGINEFLMIEGIRDYPENKVTVFDKNGVVLAEIEGYDNRNRVFFGNDHRDGTYFYYIDVKDNGVWKREKGYFVIRR
jgi:gliding motility-associated-like protein